LISAKVELFRNEQAHNVADTYLLKTSRQKPGSLATTLNTFA